MSCGGKGVCYLQGQGHSEGSYDQNMTLGQMIHHHKPECLVGQKKRRITAFKVKITVKVQNFIYLYTIRITDHMATKLGVLMYY